MEPVAGLQFSMDLYENKPVAYITVRNMAEVPLMFKVKTTMPNNYLVRPNQALCMQGQSSQVKVTFQFPLDSPQEKAAIESDKFLVQLAPMAHIASTAVVTPQEMTAYW